MCCRLRDESIPKGNFCLRTQADRAHLQELQFDAASRELEMENAVQEAVRHLENSKEELKRQRDTLIEQLQEQEERHGKELLLLSSAKVKLSQELQALQASINRQSEVHEDAMRQLQETHAAALEQVKMDAERQLRAANEKARFSQSAYRATLEFKELAVEVCTVHLLRATSALLEQSHSLL